MLFSTPCVPLGTQCASHFVPTRQSGWVYLCFYQHFVHNWTENANFANADFDYVDFQFNPGFALLILFN